jgi:hypothetical protein
MINEVEYIGLIDENRYNEGGFMIGDRPFEEIVDEVEAYLGREKVIHVSYFISDVELTKQQFLENHLKTVFGSMDIECIDVHGSEYTGYMWTDQKFIIGGHDLLEELTSHDGKYCYLKIYNAVENRNMQIDSILKTNND